MYVITLITLSVQARHSADKATNNSETYGKFLLELCSWHIVLRNGTWARTLWRDVQVGDFVKLTSNSPIPADLVIIATSEPMAICYIETSNLDGETALKLRQASGLQWLLGNSHP